MVCELIDNAHYSNRANSVNGCFGSLRAWLGLGKGAGDVLGSRRFHANALETLNRTPAEGFGFTRRVTRRTVAVAALTLVASTLASAVAVAPASAAPPLGALADAGERPGATRLSFTTGDRVEAQVDVGTGNLLVTVAGLELPGVNEQVQLGAFYNSAASQVTPVPRLGRGWGLDFSTDIKVTEHADDSVTYVGPGGLAGVFELQSGSTTAYVSPAGLKADLVKTGTGWTLTDRASQEKLKFDNAGELASREDRNGNAVTISQTSGSQSTYPDLSIDSPAGTPAAGTATVATEDLWGVTTISQGTGSVLREVLFIREVDPPILRSGGADSDTSSGTQSLESSGAGPDDLSEFVDARGRSTTFSYVSGGLLSEIAAPGGVVTRFGYDAS